MAYTSKTDLIERFGDVELAQLTDRVNGTAIDDAVLDRAINEADAVIDGYIGARYTLPLSVTPPMLSRLAADLVRWYLYDDDAPERVRQAYDDAIGILRGIGRGEIGLGLDAASEPAQDASPAWSAPDRIFTHDTLKDY